MQDELDTETNRRSSAARAAVISGREADCCQDSTHPIHNRTLNALLLVLPLLAFLVLLLPLWICQWHCSASTILSAQAIIISISYYDCRSMFATLCLVIPLTTKMTAAVWN